MRGTRDGWPCFQLEGELDISNTDLVADLLLMVPPGPAVVIVDLNAISFLDSTAVMALAALIGDLAKRRQELRIVAPVGHPIHRILAILQLGNKLPIWTSTGAGPAPSG